MSRLFEISVPAERVRLGPDGRGEMVFSVANRSTAVQRVNAGFAPSGATRGEWLSLRGEAQRELSAGATDQFLVQAQFPPGTAAGAYPFRLRVASANDRTSEEYDESPLVHFEMPAVAAAKKKPWWLAAAAAAVLAVVVVAGLLATRERDVPTPEDAEVTNTGTVETPPPAQAEVPPLVGKQVVDAMLQLQTRGLVPKLLTFTSRESTPNVVLQQDPESGAKIQPGSQVTLVVAQKPVFVPVALPTNVNLTPAMRRAITDYNLRVSPQP